MLFYYTTLEPFCQVGFYFFSEDWEGDPAHSAARVVRRKAREPGRSVSREVRTGRRRSRLPVRRGASPGRIPGEPGIHASVSSRPVTRASEVCQDSKAAGYQKKLLRRRKFREI